MKLSACALLVAFLLISSGDLLAENRELVGGIELEETEDKPETYSQTEESVIELFKSTSDILNNAVSGGDFPNPRELSAAEIEYLSVAHLYCILKNGSCLVILNGLFELDMLSSAAKGSPTCPNLTRFWKSWVANDMERRIEYRQGLGLVEKKNNFNKNIRPQFIRCEASIQKELAQHEKGGLRARYQNPSYGKRLEKTALFLEALKEKVGNLFIATGTEQKTEAAKGKK